ncbi:hypothetical protein, partial [Microcystis sp. M034S1]|uniref:hypothetical protein n=1 Tax=Microcystis sp. M034S1 TaxID=2771111 RepID=UPI00258F805E
RAVGVVHAGIHCKAKRGPFVGQCRVDPVKGAKRFAVRRGLEQAQVFGKRCIACPKSAPARSEFPEDGSRTLSMTFIKRVRRAISQRSSQ